MRTVLLAEDEPNVCDLLTEALRAQGYNVLTAACGADVLRVSESITDDQPILIIDYHLPDMNGFTLAAKLLEKFPGAVAICTSGMFTDYDVAEIKEFTVLPKPFTMDKLIQTINNRTAKRAASL